MNESGRMATQGGTATAIFSRIKLFLEMIKFSHTVFALPFAFAGAVLAARGLPSFYQSVLDRRGHGRGAYRGHGAQSSHRRRDRRPQSAHQRAGNSCGASGERNSSSMRRSCRGTSSVGRLPAESALLLPGAGSAVFPDPLFLLQAFHLPCASGAGALSCRRTSRGMDCH